MIFFILLNSNKYGLILLEESLLTISVLMMIKWRSTRIVSILLINWNISNWEIYMNVFVVIINLQLSQIWMINTKWIKLEYLDDNCDCTISMIWEEKIENKSPFILIIITVIVVNSETILLSNDFYNNHYLQYKSVQTNPFCLLMISMGSNLSKSFHIM